MISIGEIIEATALALGHEPHEIVTAAKGALLARHVAIYLARVTTPASLPEIARHFGRDHTTILYVVKKVEGEIAADRRMGALVRSLTEQLRYRSLLNLASGIDAIAVAERIAADPVRAPYRVTVQEIVALASACRDLWDVGLAAEDMARQLTDDGPQDNHRIAALGRAIIEQMAALCGETPKEQTNGSSHS